MYVLENKSFEKKWMRVQHKKLENEQQRTYKEVRGGKLYEKEHKAAKMVNKNNRGFLIKYTGYFF